MNNSYQTVDDILNNKYGKKKTKPLKQAKVKKVKTKKEKTKKSKKFIVGMIALVTAGVIALSSGVAVLVNYFKKKNNDVPKTPNNSIVQIDDMGAELEFPENNTSKYGNTTGDINVDEIVEKNGKFYVDKDSADKSDKKGTSSFDNKNNTLIEEDGKIKEKTEDYEIKDDKGNTVQKGELDDDGIPDGYAWDPVLKKYVPESEVGKYVYADATYYDEEGTVIINKGDVVAKETLEKAKKYLTTTKKTNSSSNTTTSSTTTSSATDTSSKNETSSTTTTSNEGKVNANGTYTIFGLTFESKADYEQWVLQGYEGYAEADGIMMPEEEILKQIQKTK